MVIDVNKILYQIDGNKNNISRLLLALNNSKEYWCIRSKEN